MTIQELCLWMGRVGASDLHLKDGRPPLVRIDGCIKPFDLPNLTGKYIEDLLTPIMSSQLLKQFHETCEADFSHALPGEARFRINVFRQRGETGAVLRHIPIKVPVTDDFDLPDIMNRIADHENGLVLVTGPTGSGKTTTLACMIEHINRTRPVHIMTIEDPIEFVYEDKMAAINQRELGIDTISLDAALKAVLRQDPDIILMGELRDRQTIAFALTASETGHLVFGTLHTNSAVQTLERILDMTPPEVRDAVRIQLSRLLRGIVCQRLVARIGGGRRAAQEILVLNDTIQQLLAENKLWEVEKAVEEGSYYGMQTFNQSLAAMVAQGLVTKETALSSSDRPGELELIFKGIQRGAAPSFNASPGAAQPEDGGQRRNAIAFKPDASAGR
ncbi:MAG: type IV pilus twitching motility protein PilT [Planctomycetota bacterium]|jgi:twitching motility protein PilT|nr:type IV pilus twitching motility protein PilT [Planctomycetota bacterium]